MSFEAFARAVEAGLKEGGFCANFPTTLIVMLVSCEII